MLIKDALSVVNWTLCFENNIGEMHLVFTYDE